MLLLFLNLGRSHLAAKLKKQSCRRTIALHIL